MKATNFEHQTYYAERALIAMEKSEGYMGDCGCAQAEDKTYYLKKSLEKAISPADWDAGRFYTKKSKGLISELISALDECTLTRSANEPVPLDSKAVNEIEKDRGDISTLQNSPALEKSLEALEKNLQTIQKLMKENNSDDNSETQIQQKLYAERIKKIVDNGLKDIESDLK